MAEVQSFSVSESCGETARASRGGVNSHDVVHDTTHDNQFKQSNKPAVIGMEPGARSTIGQSDFATNQRMATDQ